MSATRYWAEWSLPTGSFSALPMGPLVWASEWEWEWWPGSMLNLSLRLVPSQSTSDAAEFALQLLCIKVVR